MKFRSKLNKAFKVAMATGEDLNDPDVLNKIFEVAAFRVEYRYTDNGTVEDADGKTKKGVETLHGYAIIDCAKVKYTKDWQAIRGRRIATVFQDPMTSLNPVITIGKQIMTVILKHQKCSQAEAKRRTIDIMGKVGIPNPEDRFNDYPFEYSGGMRQRIVIAIALSCQPKILICDEPTTALDVTIQAQIIRLIKDLQQELGYTTVYITHDLGVVANVAERVAVLYAGQIVEIGTVEEVFYDPRHPYTWALLSSLPQLCEKGTDLFSIPGTPPSLYNKIKGDAFAPRNKYAMAIDLEKEPPMFKITDTHYAKTWLLDPRAPKMEIPENIRDLHEKMQKSYVEYKA
ncbi:MAG: ABC transporter ATP-binding protein [Clostridia bacterium]|nr:ABC transporter ATP-binding protein [Clostridia bacterium]